MNTFAVLFVCVQACLVQSVFGQYYAGCGGPAGCAPAAAVATPGFVTPSNYAPGAIGAYGYGGGLGDFPYPGGFNGGYSGGLGGAYPSGFAGYGQESYGGAGEGNVAVAGELPIVGATTVAGQVPVLGAVSFGGAIPAAGAVTIAGNCACGCGCSGAPYVF